MKKLNKKIIPLNLVVVIKLNQIEDKSSPGGIYIPVDMNETHQDTGVVESIGALAFSEYKECPIKVGDEVCFDRYAGKEMWDEKNIKITHRIVSDRDIWAKLVEVEE